MNFADYHAIEKLVTRYAVLADRPDMPGIAEHYADCVIHMPGGLVFDVRKEGVEAYLQWYRDLIRVYPDSGTPKTRRLVGTIVIDEDGPGKARAQCNIVCFQATEALPLQAICAGTLYDRFEKRDGEWRIVERREDLELFGDMTHHVTTAI